MFRAIFIFFLTILSCSKFNNNNFSNKDKFVEGMQLGRNIYLEAYIEYSDLIAKKQPIIYFAKTAKKSNGKKNILNLYEIDVKKKECNKRDNPSLIETDNINQIFEISFDKTTRIGRVNKSVTFVKLPIAFDGSVKDIQREITKVKKDLNKYLKSNEKEGLYLDEHKDINNQIYILDIIYDEQLINYFKEDKHYPIFESNFFQCIDNNDKIINLPNGNSAIVLQNSDQKIDIPNKDKIFWIIFFKFNEYYEMEILDVAIKNRKRDITKIINGVDIEIEDNEIYLIHKNISKEKKEKMEALNFFLLNDDHGLRSSGIMEYIFDINESIKDQIGTSNYIKIDNNRYAFVAKNISVNIPDKVTWKKNKDGSFTKLTSNINHTSNDAGEAEPYVATFTLDSRGKVVILDIASLIRNTESEAVFLDEDTDIKLSFKNKKLIAEYRTNILEGKEMPNKEIVFQMYAVFTNNPSDKRTINSLCNKRYILELLNDIINNDFSETIKSNAKKIIDIVERYENIDSSYDQLLQIVDDIENDKYNEDDLIEDNKIKDIDSPFLPNSKKDSEKDLEELIRFKMACNEVRRYRHNKNIINIYDGKSKETSPEGYFSLIYSKIKGLFNTSEQPHNENVCPLCSGASAISNICNSMFPIDKCRHTNLLRDKKDTYKYNFSNSSLIKDQDLRYRTELSDREINRRFGIADMDICYESATFVVDEEGNLRTSSTSRKRDDKKRMTSEVGGNIFAPKVVLSGNVIRRVIPLPD